MKNKFFTRQIAKLLILAIMFTMLPAMLLTSEKVTTAGMPVATGSVDNGLIAHYSLNEGSGNVATDVTGNGYDGIIQRPAWVDGPNGKALNFNGGSWNSNSNTVIELPMSVFDETENGITISMLVWIENTNDRINALYSAGIVDSEHMVMMATAPNWDGGRPTGQRMSMKMEFNDAQVISDRDNRKQGKHTTPEREWVLLTYTQDGDNAKMYVNGELVTQHNEYVYRIKDLGKKPNAYPNLCFDKWYVGVIRPYGGDDGLLGKVADIRIYDRALSAMELEDLSNLDLVARYDFLDTSTNMVMDSSLYGHHGTKSGDVAISGGEAVFNGNGKITVDPAVFNYATEDITITAYVNVSDLANSGSLLSIGSAAGRLWTLSPQISGSGTGVKITTPEMLNRIVAESGKSLRSAVWGQITYVQEGKSARVFLDGELVANSDVLNPVSWYAQNGTFEIGGGSYGAPAFNGSIAELRVYKRVLNVDEIRRVGDFAAINCTMKSITLTQGGSLADVEGGVTGDLNLFSKAENHGVKILWESNRNNLICPDGSVTRPNAGRIQVRLTANIAKNGITVIKKFPVIVKGESERGLILHYDFSDIKGINYNDQNSYMGLTIPDVTGNGMEGMFRLNRPIGSLDDGGWDRMRYIPNGGTVAGSGELDLGHSVVTVDDEVLAAARRDGGAISFAFRIKPRADIGGWRSMLGIGSSNRDVFLINASSGNAPGGVRAMVGREGSENPTAISNPLTMDQWNTVVVTHDGANTMKLYVNGQYIGQNTNARSPVSVVAPSRNFFILGNATNIRGFGDPWPVINYDDFRIYNYALSDNEANNIGTTMNNDWNTKNTKMSGTSTNLSSLSLNGVAGKIYSKGTGTTMYNNKANNDEVYVVLEKGTDLSAVTFTASALAGTTISPASGTILDFSQTQKRTITVTNGGVSKKYIVHAEVANGYEWPDEQALPSFSELAPTLEAFKSHNIHSYNENELRAVFASLQGLVNYNQPRLVLQDSETDGWDGIGDSADRWLVDTKINFTKTKDWVQLMWKYRYLINCIVPYTSNADNGIGGQNIATAIAGVEGGLPVEKNSKIYRILTGAPFYIPDYTSGSYTPKVSAVKTAYTTTVQGYSDTSADRVNTINFISNTSYGLYTHLNKRVVSVLAGGHPKARDFAIATKSAVVWGISGNATEQTNQRNALNTLVGSGRLNIPAGKGVFVGFWPDEGAGIAFGTNGAAYGTTTQAGGAPGGLATVPMDHFENYTVFSGQSREVNPAPIPKKPDYNSNLYYASIYMSDGDNLQYNQGVQRFRNRIGARETYEYPFTWTFTPAMLDAAPQMMNWYYETATWGMDSYVAGPSGLGYMTANNFPNNNTTAWVGTFAERTNHYFERTNLRIVTMWSNYQSSNASLPVFVQKLPYLLGLSRQDRDTQTSGGSGDSARTQVGANLHYLNNYNVPLIWFGGRTASTTYPAWSYNGGDSSNWDSVVNNNQRRDPAAQMITMRGNATYNTGFGAVQFVPWKTAPDRVKYDFIGLNSNGTSAGNWGLTQNSNTINPNISIVRSDHQMMLVNERNNKPINVALQKNADASGFDPGYEPGKGVDGSNGRKYSWQSSKPGDKWLQVDLADDNTPTGRRFNISKYVVQNAGISAGYDSTKTGSTTNSLNTTGWIFQTSTDGITWTNVQTVTNNTADIRYMNVSGTGTQNVRYARLYIPEGQEGADGVARVLDLEVHAVPGTAMTVTTGTTALNNLINKNLNQNDYSTESWIAYTGAKTAAQVVASNGSRTVRQLDDAMYSLSKAMNAMTTDKILLEREIVLSLDEEQPENNPNWSYASWAAFVTALETVWTVYNDKNSTQKVINDSASLLNEKRLALTAY